MRDSCGDLNKSVKPRDSKSSSTTMRFSSLQTLTTNSDYWLLYYFDAQRRTSGGGGSVGRSVALLIQQIWVDVDL